MATCLNKNSMEYQTSLRMSGLSEFKFNAIASQFVEEHGRFPELDEIPNANSRQHLMNALKVSTIEDNNFIKNEVLSNVTGTEDVKEANIRLNNKYRDLEIKITPLSDFSTIQINRRPSKWGNTYEGGILVESDVSQSKNIIIFNKMLEKLANLYGINFKMVTNEELASESWKNLVDDAKTTNAFVYNNDIYINISNSSIDAPLHEMLHIFLGSVRYSNPDLYFSLTSLMDAIPNKKLIANNYKDRTNSDLNEEILVTEFSRYLTGQDSMISKIPNKIMYEVFYNMNRVLDSVLFGVQSVNTLNPIDLYNNSLLDLSKKLGSAIANNRFSGSLDIKSSEVHRILANTKSDLIKKGDLLEICE